MEHAPPVAVPQSRTDQGSSAVAKRRDPSAYVSSETENIANRHVPLDVIALQAMRIQNGDVWKRPASTNVGGHSY